MTAGIALPLQSCLIAIIPAAIFPIIIGIKREETLLGPFSKSFVCSTSKVPIPPIPVPNITPNFSGSTFPSIPLSSTACAAAATASCAYLSVLNISFTSRYSFGSKPFTSAASFALKPSVSKKVIGAIPFFPFLRLFHVSLTLFPTGVTAPKPVTTTRLHSDISFSSRLSFTCTPSCTVNCKISSYS